MTRRNQVAELINISYSISNIWYTNGYSIEQILSRVTLNDTDTLIKCSGIALLSNGSKQNINYESYKDSQNDWITKYSLIR